MPSAVRSPTCHPLVTCPPPSAPPLIDPPLSNLSPSICPPLIDPPLSNLPSFICPPLRCMMESWLEAKLGARAAADEEQDSGAEEAEGGGEEEEGELSPCKGTG